MLRYMKNNMCRSTASFISTFHIWNIHYAPNKKYLSALRFIVHIKQYSVNVQDI